MVSNNNCMNLILDMVPEFKAAWQDHLDFWGSDQAGLSNDMAEFSSFLIANIEKISEERKQDIFLFAEKCLEEGDESVKDAIATCFLENILNAVSDEAISPEIFIKYLGEKSKEFCKSWDEFTGVSTPGLYN